ncbi:AMP-binding protein [Marinobacterium arenosum]|uniref:AMP-binding protein n=1 Tax=Marinobacterium arenosum TaxID=2862496 RepID=UPI001C97245B|nr:AMP-binding protein [Marinobacterium arenosum]MBY4675728.1 AMP-binding protein [Marinobacterium arenosum]
MVQHAADRIPEYLNPHNFTSLPQLLDYLSQRYGERPAFTSFGQTLSFRQLDRLSAAFAGYLQQQTSLEPGDRIAIQLPNLIQYPVVLFGALRAGLVVVNTNPLYTPAEMRHQFRDAGVKALVVHRSMAGKVEAILDQVELDYIFTTQVGDLHDPIRRVLLNAAVKYLKKMEPAYCLPTELPLLEALNMGRKSRFRPMDYQPGDLAVLQYTGGTTGVAKGAMLTHANLISNMLQAQQLLDRAPKGWQELVVAPLPLYHIYAFLISLVVMSSGGHSLLITNPRDLNGFVATLKKASPTAFIGLNTLFVALCGLPAFRALDFSRLRLTVSGGMALTQAAADQWHQVTGCPVTEGYGLTEASPVVAFNPPDAVRFGTIGVPMAASEVKVVDQQHVRVNDGEKGMLCVRGPQVMKGYWRKPKATAKAFTADGYLITGDIAIQEADGYLRIVDRAKDVIIVSGFNVYPAEVEDRVCTHPDVIECAAIGVPDEHSGEVVQLYVVLREGAQLDEAAVIDWCAEHLARYKIPRRVIAVTELPKTNVGKVLRRELRDQAVQSKAADQQRAS